MYTFFFFISHSYSSLFVLWFCVAFSLEMKHIEVPYPINVEKQIQVKSSNLEKKIVKD